MFKEVYHHFQQKKKRVLPSQLLRDLSTNLLEEKALIMKSNHK
jgi:hypothetical protein